MPAILFHSENPETNYKLSKKSFVFYVLFIIVLFPLLYFFKNIYTSSVSYTHLTLPTKLEV